ncbi:copper resistance CopC family protein [Nonomuraea sp. NEAU-A123]|uniref:copper resistance CopC family protein n=1 Tax=Nonomuraea sp. NEAU-A123 TaxID=2839649 RepID=UPI001BE42A06|nr:copper resistance CopC family protein [Nonomuraea sp. NEAU-A123]MBT2229100.1 copper resistance protein CopC [Nonomuraea sp. NEAU-A123]
MKRSPFAALTALLAALVLLGTAGPALAHDALKSSDPAKGATVESIDKVRLEFTSPVRIPVVIVRGPGGTAYQSGDPHAGGKVVTQELKGTLPNGKYTIAYRVVSSDGHPIEGEIPFTVKGAPSPSPSASEESQAPVTQAPASQAASPAPASQAPADRAVAAESATSASFPVWLLIVVGALVGIGIGFLFSARKKPPADKKKP